MQRSSKSLFKHYQRLSGRLNYREGWIDGSTVIEHWGVCGERGEHREHHMPRESEARNKLEALKATSRDLGFRPIAVSRPTMLVIEYVIDERDLLGSNKRRHAIEEFLNQQTGWLGLGHCDGGSIGSGLAEVFCRVVDFAVAKDVLARALAGSPYSDFRRIYRQAK
jgi:hypothetical protein